MVERAVALPLHPRRMLYWSTIGKVWSLLYHGGGFSYHPGRMRRHFCGGGSLLSHIPAKDSKLSLVECITSGALFSTGKAHQWREPGAGSPYSFNCRNKSSLTVSFQQAKSLPRERTPDALVSTLKDLESSCFLKPSLSGRPERFLLRNVGTHASTTATQNRLAYAGAGDGATRAVCPTVTVGRFSWRKQARDGGHSFTFPTGYTCKASSDAGLDEERLDCKTVNSSVPEKGAAVLSPQDVVRRLQSQTDAKSALRFFEWAGQQAGYEHPPAAYCALVDILGAAREWDALTQVRLAIERTKFNSAGLVLVTLARIYCEGQMFEEALECVRKMQNPKCRLWPSQFNKILDVLVKTGHFDKAHEMYKHMLAVGCSPDPCTFNILLNGFGKAGKLGMMENLIQEMKDKCCEPTVVTFGTLVNVLCKAGRQDEAYKLFTSNKAMANLVVYNAMVHGLGKIGRVEQALKLFEEMKDKDFIPQVNTVNIVIQCLGLANRIEEAWALFQGMTSMHLDPDLFTYNLMLKILIKDARVANALKLLKEMRRRRCMPDTVTYGTLIYGLGETGDVDNARKLFQEMQVTGLKPNVIVYGALIGALCKGGKLDEGIMVFNEMLAAGCTPDEFVCVTVCCNLFKAGRVHEAKQLFDRMGNKDRKTYLIAYNAAIDGLGKSGEVDGLWTLFQEMVHTGCEPDVFTYNTLIFHLGKSGDVDRAYKVFLDMQASGCSPDVVSYSTLIALLCKRGRTVHAFELFEDMNEKGVAPNVVTYGSIIGGLCRAGQFERAFLIYKKMISQRCVLNEIAYCTLIQGFSGSLEHIDESYALFKEMTEKGYSSNRFTSHLLMRSLKKAGKMYEVQFVRSRSSKRQKSRQLGG